MGLFSNPTFRSIRKWTFRIFLGFMLLSFLWVLALKWINPGTTLLMISRSGDKTLLKQWVQLDDISKNMQLAVICGEDQNFCQHWGFDFKAIKSAAEHNMKGGKKRGASTISQQTAKNVFLWEGRSWLRKGLEVWFTALIELLWGKERIMEVYLNVIETGDGIFGVEAAAQNYYGKTAGKLSKNEAAHISGLLPCPRTCGLNSRFTSRRAQVIYYSMTRFGIELEYLK
ncbi:MAG: monofunctional biosynthetic peptidoglycan transglycosylase [Bacteroidetes bacterium]|jgi:monofunctional glycosyltransferase|nr:monofunctional biosynthetic peptidoglycan transglycosylase [Bacteroidota bacterium]